MAAAAGGDAGGQAGGAAAALAAASHEVGATGVAVVKLPHDAIVDILRHVTAVNPNPPSAGGYREYRYHDDPTNPTQLPLEPWPQGEWP